MKLPQLHVGFGTQCGPATFFPVWADAPATVGLDTGKDTRLAVSELPLPQVSRLVVTNQGAKPVLLTEGSLLEGGQQHRINTRTTLIGSGETQGIDVLCVEEGRWHGSPLHRNTGRRAPMHIQASLHSAATHQQSEVWRRVQRFEGVRTSSATRSLVDHLDAPRPTGFRPPNLIEGQRGVIIGFGGQILALELFGSAALFGSRYTALMDSVLLDLALLGGSVSRSAHVAVAAQAARDFVVSIASRGFDTGNQAEHRSAEGTILSRRLQGRHPSVSSRGLSIGGTHVEEPQIAHLSSWNTKHRMLAAV